MGKEKNGLINEENGSRQRGPMAKRQGSTELYDLSTKVDTLRNRSNMRDLKILDNFCQFWYRFIRDWGTLCLFQTVTFMAYNKINYWY